MVSTNEENTPYNVNTSPGKKTLKLPRHSESPKRRCGTSQTGRHMPFKRQRVSRETITRIWKNPGREKGAPGEGIQPEMDEGRKKGKVRKTPEILYRRFLTA